MPEQNQYQVKTLIIDGKEIAASEHQTILEGRAKTASTFRRCATSTACAAWARAAFAWWKSRATTSCCRPA